MTGGQTHARQSLMAGADANQGFRNGLLSMFIVICLALIWAVLIQRHRNRRALASAVASAAQDKVVAAAEEAELKAAVENLPTITHEGPPAASPRLADSPESTPSSECIVCLGVYVPGDVVRTLPCGHFFHKSCIDEWLLGKGRRRGTGPAGLELRRTPACPVCKQSPLPLRRGQGGVEMPQLPAVSSPADAPAPSAPPSAPRVLPGAEGSGPYVV